MITNIAERVDQIVGDCLFTEDEIQQSPNGTPEDAVIVSGIVNNFGFNPARLESHRDDVRAILDMMPEEFHAGGEGGGHSFLRMCMTRNGEQWGVPRNMEVLIALGIGLGYVRYCLPREMWTILPGEMPYLTIDTRPKEAK